MNKNPHSTTTLFQEMGLSAEKAIHARSHKLKTLRIDTNHNQKKHIQNNIARKIEGSAGDQHRTCLIDDWKDKKKINMLRFDKDLEFFSLSSSSSHSSSPSFSSSECESVLPRSNMDQCCSPIKQKQFQTTTVHSQISKPYQEMPLRSESKTQKILTDINNSKLPVSPGSKLARFFSSMLNRKQCGTKATTANLSHHVAMDNLKCKSQLSDTCSPASSSTRSCLIKKSPSTPRDKSVKKSVRFYPANVENSVDIRTRNAEHSQSSVYKRKDENLGFTEADDYKGASELVTVEDDADDAASDASSELFEIDHIIFGAATSNSNKSHNGELPVFETTKVNDSIRTIYNAEIVF